VRRVATLLAAGLLALTMLPGAVLADTTGGGGGSGVMDLTITSTRLIAKVAVEVKFEVTCDPAPDGASWEMWGFDVSVKQASGRAVASGYAEISVDRPDTYCSGTPHAMSAVVSVDPAGVPFKTGSAAVAVSGYTSYYGQVCDEFGSCDYFSGGSNGSTGWVPVRLQK
jgi:hypothetical protein